MSIIEGFHYEDVYYRRCLLKRMYIIGCFYYRGYLSYWASIKRVSIIEVSSRGCVYRGVSIIGIVYHRGVYLRMCFVRYFSLRGFYKRFNIALVYYRVIYYRGVY